uniref:C2H2-type domain-containing protein n=1 Tax=Davidia involucrata TaxID=16924 RepID=A0A5B6YMS4_DAVIN
MMSDGLSSIPSTMIRGFIQDPNPNPNPNTNPVMKRKRNQPGTPDPDAEVIGLSPKSLMATNRFICEICNKGFQRDQNLQLHRRGHNLPWKLKQRTSKEVRKKVYICPEKSCVHHDPLRALGDLTGIKKHYSRKHGEKKWKCDKCSKKYAVHSDWKAHSKICGTREYRCDCGTLFSRKDSFITHRAFCDALAEESARITSVPTTNLNFSGTISTDPQAAGNPQFPSPHLNHIGMASHSSPYLVSNSPELAQFGLSFSSPALPGGLKVEDDIQESISSLYYNNNIIQQEAPAHLSATAMLQKAAQMGSVFGLMTSSLSLSSVVENRNELLQKQFGRQAEEFILGNNNTRNMMLPSNGKQSKASVLCNEVESTMTCRDFLGVGTDHMDGDAGRTLLTQQQQQELVKFASMGSPMDFTQYTGTH